MWRKIDYYCFLGTSGYATAAKYYISALKNKWDIKIIPLDFNRIRATRRKDTIDIYHCVPHLYHRFKRSRPSIGFATFENIKVPDSWISLLKENNVIVSPSKFNQKSFPTSEYFPHCLDMSLWNKKIGPIIKRSSFTFLFLGTWKKRKGYELLLQAFSEEFKHDKRVKLLIKTSGKKPSFFGERIEIVTKNIPENQMPKFIKSADCLVSPTLGEGFGLPGLQAMAVEVPVIISDWSGCQDYANEKTAFLLHPASFKKISRLDDVSQYKDLEWPVFSMEELKEKMRIVVEDKRLRAEKAQKAYDFVHERFSFDVVRKRFEEIVTKL